MNAFEAAEKQGRAAELQKQLEKLFNSQNKSQDGTSIPATFLRVTVERVRRKNRFGWQPKRTCQRRVLPGMIAAPALTPAVRP